MEDSTLLRTLSWRTAAATVIANMIGAGIFTTSGLIARDVGAPALVLGLWILGGLIALAGALAYAELGAAMPRAGGEYVYLREAFGSLLAFLSGWTSLLAGFSGAIAASLLAFVAYATKLIPTLQGQDPRIAAILALWVLTAVHLIGSPVSGKFQGAVTSATAAGILVVVVFGFVSGHGSAAHFKEPASASGSIAVSLIFVMYAYSGWNAAAYLGGEIVEPARNLPRALIVGTSCVIALYVALNLLYLFALPIRQMSGEIAIAEKAVVALFGRRAAIAVSALIALALLSSASAMVMAGPRVYFAMARDGLLPCGFAAAESAPRSAITLQSAWTTVLIAGFGMLERVVLYAGIAITIFSALAVAAVIILRRRNLSAPRAFTMPLYPWTALAYLACSVWILAYVLATRPVETALGLATIASGVPIYWVSRHLEAIKIAGVRALP